LTHHAINNKGQIAWLLASDPPFPYSLKTGLGFYTIQKKPDRLSP